VGFEGQQNARGGRHGVEQLQDDLDGGRAVRHRLLIFRRSRTGHPLFCHFLRWDTWKAATNTAGFNLDFGKAPFSI
jgi:hypothetical protein